MLKVCSIPESHYTRGDLVIAITAGDQSRPTHNNHRRLVAKRSGEVIRRGDFVAYNYKILLSTMSRNDE